MDKLDPARTVVAEAIGALENAIEALMPAQAPMSTEAEISYDVETLRNPCAALIDVANQIESRMIPNEGT